MPTGLTPGRRRLLRRLLLLALAATCLWLLSSYAVAYRLTRRPRPAFAEPAPALAWARVRAFRLTTADRQELGAWFLEGRAGRPVVLLLHGFRGSRRNCLDGAKLLAEAGCGVLLISLRAHGDSTGVVHDFGYGARRDVTAAVGWLEKHCPGRPVVVWGQSLGSAAAVFAAGELGGRVRGYILECPFRDLRTAARNRTELYLPPVLAQAAYAGLSLVSPLVLEDVDRISPLEAAGAIPESARVLVLAGGADRRARPEEARAIYERIASHARLVIVDGADHVRLQATDPEAYRDAVLGLVEECRARHR
jgi:alpha-beta hydrolase superfamily lysophospholipase